MVLEKSTLEVIMRDFGMKEVVMLISYAISRKYQMTSL